MNDTADENLLVAFFDGTGQDQQHRSLEEILHWPNSLLERCHDYMQTLFPLPERSRFSTPSILIDERVFDIFRANEELRDNLRRAFLRMLTFYGLEASTMSGEWVIQRADNFPQRETVWVMRVNHNHLRITRILRSLRVLGLEEEAQAFFRILTDIYLHSSLQSRPSKESMKFWTRAVRRPLNFAPDVYDTTDPMRGEGFLVRYEAAKARREAGEEEDASRVDGRRGFRLFSRN